MTIWDKLKKISESVPIEEWELIPRPIEFVVGRYHVASRGDDLWAITDGSAVLNCNDEWEYEPLPSSRTDEFLKRCRFSKSEAIIRAQNIQRSKSA